MTDQPRTLALACVAASILFAAAGQVLLKRGVTALGPLGSATRGARGIARRLFGNVPLLAGMAIYFLSAVLWLYGLSRVELSYAYPLLALNMILVTFGARYILKERVSAFRWAGIALIAAGVALVASS